jgi:hypothetical protein
MRRVKWHQPARDRFGKQVRTSKCGRYRIITRAMLSGKGGSFNSKAYEVQRADGSRVVSELQNTLSDALDVVEVDNDPNWEPAS